MLYREAYVTCVQYSISITVNSVQGMEAGHGKGRFIRKDDICESLRAIFQNYLSMHGIFVHFSGEDCL